MVRRRSQLLFVPHHNRNGSQIQLLCGQTSGLLFFPFRLSRIQQRSITSLHSDAASRVCLRVFQGALVLFCQPGRQMLPAPEPLSPQGCPALHSVLRLQCGHPPPSCRSPFCGATARRQSLSRLPGQW